MTDTGNNPLVSIVVRTKDRPKLLGRALRSIVGQLYRPIEIVLVNDGGCDLDIDQIRDLLQDVLLKTVIHDKSTGRAHAANAGIAGATGYYVCFLDDDDELLYDHVSTLVSFLQQSDHRIAYTDATLVYQTFDVETGRVIEEEKGAFHSRDFTYHRLLFENYIPLMCLMFPRDLLQTAGGFDEDLELYEDWDLLIRISAEHPPYHLKKVTARYNIWSREMQITERAKYSGETNQSYRRIFFKHQHRLAPETMQSLLSELYAAREEQVRLGAEKDSVIAGKDMVIADKEKEIEVLRQNLVEKEFILAEIHNSLGWRLLSKYRGMKERFFPEGTQRRRLYDYARRGVYIVKNEGFGSFLQRGKRRFSSEFMKSGSKREKVTLSTRIRPLSLPLHGTPLVSIIIPVFNKAVYTFNCLESIVDNTGDIPFEVVVVDNASTDNTAAMLRDMQHVTVITHAENRGFVEACNSGADAAKGEYLVFLNNDTKVTNGWLRALLDVFDHDRSAGLVGAKLIYPDGKLQEAGGIIWNDATGWNFGRYDDPEKPQYNYLKEADYCSGACLMIRKVLFERVGRFDLTYAPAYYEDTDLAFSVRKAGYKVIYQPLAEVIHFEGTTAGTDVTQGMKQYQEINKEKFLAKWRDVLAEGQYPAGKDVFLARDRSRQKPVLLYIDHYVPTFDRDAGAFITLEYLKIFLDLGFQVVFWPDNLNRMLPYTTVLQQMGIEVIYGQYTFGQYMKETGKYLDIAFVSRPSIAPKYIEDIRLFSRAKVFYVAHDLHFLREKRRAEISDDSQYREMAETWRQTEIYLISKSDVTLLFSTAERDLLLREISQGRVEVLPWVQPLNEGGKDFRERKDILFIGGFLHSPNEDAVLWFVREVFPLIKREIPEMKFIIAGSHPTEKVLGLRSEDIVVTGYIEDVSPYFTTARIFVSPLRYGAGFKGKNVLAMSYGLPVITTSIGAEGIEARDGEDILIADDAIPFAGKVKRLYTEEDLWNRLSLHGREVVKKHYSSDAGRKKALELFGDPAAIVRRREFSAGQDRDKAAGRPDEGSAGISETRKPPYRGVCTVCGKFTRFDKDSDNLRETFICEACGSNSRNRHLAKVLYSTLGGDGISSLAQFAEAYPQAAIFEAQSTGAISTVLRKLPGYVCSEFLEGVPRGATRKGVRCEDLEHLTFADNSFDVVISQDVFEHVRDPWEAFREVRRVLKPSGVHVFTIPYHQDAKTVRRVRVEGDQDVHVLPRVFHGDGIRDGLVYTDFGYDLFSYLDTIGFATDLFWPDDGDRDEHFIYWNVVFVSRK